MKTVLIIQARMGSSRLPGKVLLPLGGSTILGYVVDRCRLIKGVMDVVVATSVLAQDDEVAQWCRQNQVTCSRGSEDDVLDRYYQGALPYKPDYVMRVTGDCPFTDYELGSRMNEEARSHPCDIIRLEGELPRGLEPQLVSFAALEYMHRNAKESRHREHVTYYAYEYPDLFHSHTISVPAEMRHPKLRITIDTEDDYRLIRAIADHFGMQWDMQAAEIVRFLLENPDIAAINAHVEQKPVI